MKYLGQHRKTLQHRLGLFVSSYPYSTRIVKSAFNNTQRPDTEANSINELSQCKAVIRPNLIADVLQVLDDRDVLLLQVPDARHVLLRDDVEVVPGGRAVIRESHVPVVLVEKLGLWMVKKIHIGLAKDLVGIKTTA